MTTEAALSIEGMHCASCVASVEKAARKIPGVQACDVNLARGRAVVRFDPQQADVEKIAAVVSHAGYRAFPESDSHSQHQHDHAAGWKRRAIVGFALWLPVELIHWIDRIVTHHTHAGLSWIEWLALASSTIAIVYVGAAFYRNAWKALLRRTTDMDTLIAMGSSVAYGYSVVALIGFLAGAWKTLPNLYFMESSGLLALISLGHWMEARARTSAGKAIHDLLDLAPVTAQKVDGGEVPVAQLHIGDTILVRPGDRVAIDGVVVSGRSNVDESMISGEPIPVARTVGDEVIGGTINQDGALQVRVTRTGSETALAQIIKLVEHAQSTKPAVQRLADQIAAIFVPAVLGIALLTAIGWYIFGSADPATKWGQIAQATCSVLIIACPCALGLAVPATLMVATGRGAKLGILFRDIDALQAAERINTVVLDKTGTLTRGKPVVTSVQPSAGFTEDEILKLAASAERYSEHPLARAIVAAANQRQIALLEPEGFTNDPGAGVRATVGGRKIFVGLVRGADTTNAAATVVHVTRDEQVIASIQIADEIKPDSRRAVEALHQLGLSTALLTGDNRAAAQAIAKQVGIQDVSAEVRPDQKAAFIRQLQSRNSAVAMVGDGINDAPALAQADLGIAIGSGSDIAKETGGIVLIGDSVMGVAIAVRLGRATMKKVRQNLFFAFIYNVIAIPLAALGLLNPLLAAAAMAFSDVTVIGNALLLKRKKLSNRSSD